VRVSHALAAQGAAKASKDWDGNCQLTPAFTLHVFGNGENVTVQGRRSRQSMQMSSERIASR
jgi:hypothetical protein